MDELGSPATFIPPAPSLDPVEYKRPRSKGGKRPSISTENVRDDLLTALESGMPPEHAAGYAGVDPAELWSWVQKGEDQKRRGVRGLFRAFLIEFEDSRARGMARHHRNVAQAGEQDWHASAWILERVDPKNYGSKLQVLVKDEQRSFLEKLRAGLTRDEFKKVLTIALEPSGGGDGGGDGARGEFLKRSPDSATDGLRAGAEPALDEAAPSPASSPAPGEIPD